MGIALLVLGACVGALAASARLVAAVGGRAEVEDTAQLAVEAFRFDVRRAGFDPAAIRPRRRSPPRCPISSRCRPTSTRTAWSTPHPRR